MRVGFITYDKTVNFYNIFIQSAQQPVVGDIHDMFMPFLDGFLGDPEGSEALIAQFIEQILMPAIQVGLQVLKSS